MPLTSAQERAALILLSAGGGELTLVGGAALNAHRLTDRPTEDVDAFTARQRPVGELDALTQRVATAFRAACYTVQDVSRGQQPRTLIVTEALPGRRYAEAVKVQIGMDFQVERPTQTSLGPTLTPEELAANKVGAVYGRGAARDAEDLARLAHQVDFQRALAIADQKEIEPLDRRELAGAFRAVTRRHDREFPVPEMAAAVKAHMLAVAEHLEAGAPVPQTGPYAPAAVGGSAAGQATAGGYDPLAGLCGKPKVRGRGPCMRPVRHRPCPYHGA